MGGADASAYHRQVDISNALGTLKAIRSQKSERLGALRSDAILRERLCTERPGGECMAHLTVRSRVHGRSNRLVQSVGYEVAGSGLEETPKDASSSRDVILVQHDNGEALPPR